MTRVWSHGYHLYMINISSLDHMTYGDGQQDGHLQGGYPGPLPLVHGLGDVYVDAIPKTPSLSPAIISVRRCVWDAT